VTPCSIEVRSPCLGTSIARQPGEPQQMGGTRRFEVAYWYLDGASALGRHGGKR
jgi:hypothetical protein